MAADFVVAVTALKTELNNIAVELLNISKYPKPIYVVNQQYMEAVAYRRYLSERMTEIHQQIMLLQGPYRVTSYMRPV